MPYTLTLPAKKAWRYTWTNPLLKAQMLIGTSLQIAICCLLPSFFNTVQKRNGVVLNDWLLNMIPAHNVSIPIFMLIWGMLGLLAYRAIKNPSIFTTYVWVLVFVCIARVVTISLVALDPPAGLIPLTDPLTNFFYGKSNITKDLFFSGHTSTMVMIFLSFEKRNDKIISFMAMIAVAVLLLVQHIHYSIDIIAAPLFVYPFFRLVKALIK